MITQTEVIEMRNNKTHTHTQKSMRTFYRVLPCRCLQCTLRNWCIQWIRGNKGRARHVVQIMPHDNDLKNNHKFQISSPRNIEKHMKPHVNYFIQKEQTQRSMDKLKQASWQKKIASKPEQNVRDSTCWKVRNLVVIFNSHS